MKTTMLLHLQMTLTVITEHFTDAILPYRSHMCTPLPLFPFKRNRVPEGGFHPVLTGLAKLWPGLKKIIIN